MAAERRSAPARSVSRSPVSKTTAFVGIALLAFAGCDTADSQLPLTFQWGDIAPTRTSYFVEATIIEVDSDGVDGDQESTGLVPWTVDTPFDGRIERVPFGTKRSIIEMREENDPNARVVFYGLSEPFVFNENSTAESVGEVMIGPPETETGNAFTLVAGSGDGSIEQAYAAVTTTQATALMELSATPDFTELTPLTLSEASALLVAPGPDAAWEAMACANAPDCWLMPMSALVSAGLSASVSDGVSTVYARFRDRHGYPSATLAASLTQDDLAPSLAYASAEPAAIRSRDGFVITLAADEPLKTARVRIKDLNIELAELEASNDRRVFRFERPDDLELASPVFDLQFEMLLEDNAGNLVDWSPLIGSSGQVGIVVDDEPPIVDLRVNYESFGSASSCEVSAESTTCVLPTDDCSIFEPLPPSVGVLGRIKSVDADTIRIVAGVRDPSEPFELVADFDGVAAELQLQAEVGTGAIGAAIQLPAHLDPSEASVLTVRAVDTVGNFSDPVRLQIDWDVAAPVIGNIRWRTGPLDGGDSDQWLSIEDGISVTASVTKPSGWIDFAFVISENLSAAATADAASFDQLNTTEGWVRCHPEPTEDNSLSGVVIARFEKIPKNIIFAPRFEMTDQVGNLATFAPNITFRASDPPQ